ncbi:sugar ABC transporter ATP-binding protein [Aporhodopirellula aestuarii]|uniref:Sugar ABC transporter ATP-binding protein n=1 Tax=Aporhodopirellula aestuarii TaxID=2950107 RepID=A0ABT0TXY3_9BACT|nr:sugar ABC transporter ATP-binding protein [Aporhodopirellula aestuarii]MCM2369468.1 sugar ABC transporter ATP-binding protein [Aporhodopirellula aestuarii]
MKPLLTATDITKRFGPVTVLDSVSLDVRGGEIHALLGANGAGKSTLCKIISGLLTRDGGDMSIAGEAYLPSDKQTAERAGIQIVQQELNQVTTLTVAENIFLTRMPSVLGIIRSRQLADRARQVLDHFGLNDVATDTVMGTLGVGRQQMVEIATALDRQCRLLILDEPTAALGADETQRLFERLRSLRDQGIGIIYISHRLDEVAQLSDRVTVLRDGRRVCTQETSSLTTDQMVDLMTGESTSEHHSFQSFATAKTAMQVKGITAGMVQDVSFSVRHGERLGIAGLVGSGRTELLRAIFGADSAEQGTVQISDRQPTHFSHPSQAVAAGLAMVTEDRKQNGLLLRQSIRANTSISSLGKRFASLGIIRNQRERQAAQEMARQLETKCNDIEQVVATLSGGNQQKVAISKWLVRDADVFFFDEPTRGIDVAARRRIYRLIESLAQAGKAIVIVSSDLDELLETCDRIGVISAGRWIDDFDRDSWSTDQIMQAAFAGYRQAESVA